MTATQVRKISPPKAATILDVVMACETRHWLYCALFGEYERW